MGDDDDPFQDIEDLFDQLTQFDTAGSGDVAVDVTEEGDDFVVAADLPGYDSDEITVQLEDEYKLSIAAERTDGETASDTTYIQQERPTEGVSRTVTLPAPVDPDATTASHENGVLTVRLGKETGDEETDIPVN